MSKWEKVIQFLLWLALILVSGYVLAHICQRLRDDPPKVVQKLMGKASESTEEEALAWYMPGLFFENQKGTSWLEVVWDKIEDYLPAKGYAESQETAALILEDDETCHEIMEENEKKLEQQMDEENEKKRQEAADVSSKEENSENPAVAGTEADSDDSSGETDRVPSEDDGTSSEASVPDGGQTGEDAASADTLPAWATITEPSPAIDLSMESLQNYQYLLNNFFVVDPNTTTNSDQINVGSLLGSNMKLEETEGPQILIYHTHSQEEYADSVAGDESTTVIGVGDYLEELLTNVFGYEVIHMKDHFDMADGYLERSKAYNYALPAVEQVLAENPSIQVVIDLHRDGVPEDKHLVTEINGKPTAQIMYFNGLSYTVNNGALESLPNPYIADNLAFAFQLSYQGDLYYPGLTRCIYLKGYRYNLHVRPRSILLEVGAQTNTYEEAKNAMEPFSVILNKVLKGE